MLHLPFKKLLVWQKGLQNAVDIYELTRSFPRTELYALTNQMRRCSVSIPSNIAEGSQRGTNNDFAHFLSIAKGSLAELETQLEIAQRIGYCKNEETTLIRANLEELSKMLRSLIKKVRT